MAAPSIIKWTDSGVPALSRVDSSLIAVLDFCLIPKGWVKEFSAAGKAVYRAGAGERKYYRVLNDGSFYYSPIAYQYCHAKITAYDSMSDVDTGAGLWDEAYFVLSNDGTAVARPWMCIVNETALLFISMPHLTADSVTGNSLLFGFGDTIPFLPGATARSFLGGSTLYDPVTNYCTLCCPGTYSPASGNPIGCNRSIDGTRTAINTGLIANGGGTLFDRQYPFGRSSSAIYAYPYKGHLLYARPLLDDGIAYSIGDFIPGLYYPLQKGNTLNNWGDYTEDAKTFTAVRCVAQTIVVTSTNESYIGAMVISHAAEDWS